MDQRAGPGSATSPANIQYHMRFILIYKYGFFQRKTERLDVPSCGTTTLLLQHLEKKLRKSPQELIVRAKKDKQLFRVIRGWPIDHYQLADGTELQIEAPQKEQEQVLVSNSKNKYLINILGAVAPGILPERQLEKITEQEEDRNGSFAGESESDKPKKSFNVRKYLDGEIEKLLKAVQKGQLNEVVRILNEVPKELDDEALMELELQKSNLVNDLGEGGWGAIHYAVYCNKPDIIKELVRRQVDLNKCTSDGWLPLMIAANRRNCDIMAQLLEVKGVNINESTAKGTALHTSVRLGHLPGVKLLLEKDADPKAVDDKGRTCLDVCSDPEIAALLDKNANTQPQQEQNVPAKPQVFVPYTVCTLRGPLFRVKSMFMTLSATFMQLDPYEGSLIHYESEATYPKRPLEVIPVISIRSVKMIKDKSWLMKSDHSYFEIYIPEREILVCRHKTLAQQWVRGIFDAILFCNEVERNRSLKESMPKKLKILDDIKGKVIDNNPQPEVPKEQPESPSRPAYLKRVSIFKRNTGSVSDTLNPPKMSSSELGSSQIGNSELGNSMGISKSFGEKDQPTNPGSGSNTSTEPTSQNPSVAEKPMDPQREIAEQLQALTAADSKTTFSSFEIIKTLGSGAFGKVFLARHIASNKMYALKALKKKTLILKKQLKYAISEANVLKKANHPFIINLHYAFQTPNFLYLALDYCPGKDLSHHLARQVTLKEEQARFYIAELVLAVQHLHEKNIIYRDMKPENILLDAEGHIKLADFGLSKDNVEDKTKSFCGSPAYLSPEMLNQKGVSKQADLYGIGCVMYEFLVGEPPYYSDDIPELYRNIKQAKLRFPKGISEQAKSLISGLLERQPKKRLGSKDYNQIFNHPFFRGLEWQKVLSRELTPPQRQYHDSSEQQGQEQDDQQKLLKSKLNFTDNDYQDSDKKINRLINFSFVRTQ